MMERYDIAEIRLVSLKKSGVIAFLLIFLSIIFSHLSVALAQIDSDFSAGGGVKIGNSAAACDVAAEGTLRYNTASDKVDFCDGVSWKEIISAVPSTDTTPDAFAFTDLTNVSTGALTVSDVLNITGFDGPVVASVSGGGSPEISVNGGSWVSAASINPGETIQVRMTSSASVSTELIATVTIGTLSDNWSVTTKAGQTRIFRTIAALTGGDVGGLAGADAKCQAEAALAGLGGTWKAVLSDETTAAKDRLTIVFPVVNACDSSVVASSAITDFWTSGFDGLRNILNRSCGGGYGTYIWTGTTSIGDISAGKTCLSWTSSNSADIGREGTNYSYNLLRAEWKSEADESCAAAGYLICVDGQ